MTYGPIRSSVEESFGSVLNANLSVLVQAARSLADALDADSTNASLWREYRGVLTSLAEAVENGDQDSGISPTLQAAIGNVTQIRPA